MGVRWAFGQKSEGHPFVCHLVLNGAPGAQLVERTDLHHAQLTDQVVSREFEQTPFNGRHRDGGIGWNGLGRGRTAIAVHTGRAVHRHNAGRPVQSSQETLHSR